MFEENDVVWNAVAVAVSVLLILVGTAGLSLTQRDIHLLDAQSPNATTGSPDADHLNACTPLSRDQIDNVLSVAEVSFENSGASTDGMLERDLPPNEKREHAPVSEKSSLLASNGEKAAAKKGAKKQDLYGSGDTS